MDSLLCQQIDEWVSNGNNGISTSPLPSPIPLDEHSSSLTLHLLFKRDKPSNRLFSLMKRVEESPLKSLTFIKRTIMNQLRDGCCDAIDGADEQYELKDLQYLLLKAKSTTRHCLKMNGCRQKVFEMSIYDDEKKILQGFSFSLKKGVLIDIFRDRLDCSFGRYSYHQRSSDRPPKTINDLQVLLREIRKSRLQKRMDQSCLSGISNNSFKEDLKIYWKNNDDELIFFDNNSIDIPLNGETIQIEHGKDGVCTHYACIDSQRDSHPYYYNYNFPFIKETLFTDHQRRRCRICSSNSSSLKERACWVTLGDLRSPENPCLWCDDCFARMHYHSNSGDLIDDSFYLFPI